jgi:hypothetical protein
METGPNWTGPPDSLGDMAVRRSDWQAAVSLYDRAAPVASGWPELAQARRSARATLDALHWWKRL